MVLVQNLSLNCQYCCGSSVSDGSRDVLDNHSVLEATQDGCKYESVTIDAKCKNNMHMCVEYHLRMWQSTLNKFNYISLTRDCHMC